MNAFRTEHRLPSPQPNIATTTAEPGFVLRYWLWVVVVGVGAGLAGGGLMLLLHAIERLAWPFDAGVAGDLSAAVGRASTVRKVVVLAVAGAWVGVGGAILRRLAGPGGEANAAIWFRSGRLPVVSTLARGVLSIVAVGLGTSLGREAAVKQAGGAIASGLAVRAGLPPAHRRVLVACGVGAGMAAAYNVPFGGAMFALEVLLGTLSLRLVLPALAMSTIATATSWLMLPTGPIYVVGGTHLSVAIVVWSLLAGPLFGAIAAGFIALVARASRLTLRGPVAIAAPIVVLTLLGVVAIWVPDLLGNGKDEVQRAFDGKLGLSLLITLPLLKALATAGCLASGARGGLFTPTMMIGAVSGCLLGAIWTRVWPGTDLGLYGLIGAAAVLGGATQGPVSAVALMLELTRHGDATMVPMLLAVGGATLTVGRINGRSLYSSRTAAAAVHVDRGPGAVSSADTLPAVMQKLVALAGEPRADVVVRVFDDEGRNVGVIRAADVAPDRYRPLPPTAVTAGDVARPESIERNEVRHERAR